MPGLMGAVAQEQNLLVDGDLMKGKPMWTLSKNLKDISDRILEIRLEGSFSGSEKKSVRIRKWHVFLHDLFGNCFYKRNIW